jgi:uncharacterized protein
MRWLVDGYNVIRRSPELSGVERGSLEAGRQALCALLRSAARASGDDFTVVFDGSQAGGAASGGGGVRVVFSSARETADRVLARMASGGGAVVSNDREVRRAAGRAGAIAVTTDEFLSRLERMESAESGRVQEADGEAEGSEEPDDAPRGPKKGNPRKLSKKRRAAARVLGRLRSSP